MRLEVGLREIKERGSDIKLESWLVGQRASEGDFPVSLGSDGCLLVVYNNKGTGKIDLL